MIIDIIAFIIIIGLILTNAITDAPNAIATLVGTKVMSFKKAAYLSAIFNLLGIIVMSLINISVADCISSMVNLNDENNGIIALVSGILAVIIFSLIALKFGIPTSETHGLIAGLTGSSLAIYSLNAINFSEWKNIIIGLIWSVIGTYIISIITTKILKKALNKINIKNIKKAQILGSIGMSFMHGAQDRTKIHRNINNIYIYLSKSTNSRNNKSIKLYKNNNICSDNYGNWNINRR